MNPKISKNQVIQYCKEKLNKDYQKICLKLYNDVISFDPDLLKRGKDEIWAASIVWAIGGINFLNDKYSEPYASLKDVCDYFGCNTSTVGQKASKIKELLDIDWISEEYLIEGSPIYDLLDSFSITDEGYIVQNPQIQKIISDEDELPDAYIIMLEAHSKVKQANRYQLEYLFKSLLSNDEKFEKMVVLESGDTHLYYYGRPYKVLLLENKLDGDKFIITNMINQPLDHTD